MVVTSELYGVRVLGVGENDVCFSVGQALLRLWPRQRHDLSACGPAAPPVLDDRRPTPDATFETIERFRPTLYYGVPTLYAALLVALDARPRKLDSMRACVSAAEPLPARHLSSLEGEDRHGDPRRHRLDRMPAHLHRQPARRLPARHVGQAGAGLRGEDRRRERQAGAEGRERAAVDQSEVGCQVLLEQAREDGRDHGRRLAQHRRHLPPGRRRLLHLRRPQRRHDESGRHLVLAGRDRELPDRPIRPCSRPRSSAIPTTTS